MKEYPSIERKYMKDKPIYAFDKLDGSNVRMEWSAKRGFYKFGTKTQLIDKDSPIFGRAVPLFVDKYETDLAKVFAKKRWQRAVCFCELHGENSFAGNHNMDDKLTVTLFDVSIDDIILDPRDFLDCFGHLDVAPLLYNGNANEEFIHSVHRSELEGMTFEGVVCKTTVRHKKENPEMFKVKSNAWIEKLKGYCNGNMELMARLL